MSDFLTLDYTPSAPASVDSGNAPLSFDTHGADLTLSPSAAGADAQYSGNVFGFLPSGSKSPTSSVFTSPTVSQSDSVFSGLNESLNQAAKAVGSGANIYSTIANLNKKQTQTPLATNAATVHPASVAAPSSNEWIKGVPNSVVIIVGLGLGIVVLIGVLK